MTSLDKRTFSEKLFSALCATHKIPCWRIETAENRKTSDYTLYLSNRTIICEVKEISRNKHEQKSDRLLEATGCGLVLGGEPGERVRRKINKASPQLKYSSEQLYPTLLVIYDFDFLGHNVKPYEILVAMYGLQTIEYISRNGRLYKTAEWCGPKKKMTPTANTSISAIGALHKFPDRDPTLMIYHNTFAKTPLSFDIFSAVKISQFRLSNDEPGQFPRWEKF